MRRTIKIVTHKSEQYDADFPFDRPLMDVLSWFIKQLNEIPQEYRESARCEVDTTSSEDGLYDSYYTAIEISYERPETDEELAARELKELEHRTDVETRERNALRVLKARYPDEV